MLVTIIATFNNQQRLSAVITQLDLNLNEKIKKLYQINWNYNINISDQFFHCH